MSDKYISRSGDSWRSTVDCYHEEEDCFRMLSGGGVVDSAEDSEINWRELDPCPDCVNSDEWNENELETKFPPDVLDNIESVREKFEQEEAT